MKGVSVLYSYNNTFQLRAKYFFSYQSSGHQEVLKVYLRTAHLSPRKYLVHPSLCYEEATIRPCNLYKYLF